MGLQLGMLVPGGSTIRHFGLQWVFDEVCWSQMNHVDQACRSLMKHVLEVSDGSPIRHGSPIIIFS